MKSTFDLAVTVQVLLENNHKPASSSCWIVMPACVRANMPTRGLTCCALLLLLLLLLLQARTMLTS